MNGRIQLKFSNLANGQKVYPCVNFAECKEEKLNKFETAFTNFLPMIPQTTFLA